MANWQARVRALGEIAVQLHAVITLGGIVLGVFAVAVAVMSYVLNSIARLSQYGWGLPVVVAIGIVLASLLALSLIILAAAAAYRWWCLYRYPELYRQVIRETGVQLGSPELTVAPETAEPAPWKADIDKLGTALEGYIDATRGNFKNDIDRLNALGVAQHEMNESFRNQLKELQTAARTLDESLSSYKQVVASGTYLLIRALRAREAMREIVIPNDQIAMALGKRLTDAKATDYPDFESWLSDYQRWNAAVRAIDRLMMEWTRKPSYEPVSLFDLEGRHFQNSPMPPENIRTDDTIIPFKTVWLVQSSYANQRDGVFSFFNEKSVYPG